MIFYLGAYAEEKTKMNKLVKKIINRETISYVIAGFFTTGVNLISYEALYKLGLSNLSANGLAWIISVGFAYSVNKRNVFHSKSEGFLNEVIKICKFYGARLVTLIIEQVGMYIFVELLGIYRWIIKGSLAIIVIILNYIFSKFYIFKEDQQKNTCRNITKF